MLAFFTSEGRGAADRLLEALAGRLRAGGLRLAGTIQVNVERPDTPRCDMELHVLDGAGAVRISQFLGTGARGCRLDADGLERAVALVEATLDRPVDLLIVNKFGKQEVEGRGFRPVIAQAIEREIAVLTAVNSSNRAAFLDFSGGIATELPPDLAALEAWCRQAASPMGFVSAD